MLGVCRQILRRPQDADDAFQATFLVLVRKARSIRVGDSLAPWLYGVAYRTAHRARTIASRHRTAGVEAVENVAASTPDGSFELDVRPLLDEELARLPGKYRDPIVLCHLEGKTHEEAARLLAWPVGTFSGRLSRGRQLLKARLERRGVEAPSVMLAARWLTETPAALSSSLVETTLEAAARFVAAAPISTSVQSLTQGVLRTMLLNKLKVISLAIVAVGATSGVLSWAIRTSQAANPSNPPQAGRATGAQAEDKAAEVSRDPFAGSPLGQSVPAADPFGGMARSSLPGMGPMGKNEPNMARHQLPVLRSASILVVESADRGSLQAMSLDSVGNHEGTWQKLPIPPGITASPLMVEDTVALGLKGKAIDHVAAFSRYTGKWSIQHLLRPAEERISPYLLPGGAVYQVGNDVYAFSARQGSWGALHLEGAEKAQVALSVNDIDVLQGNRLYVFSLKNGRFSDGVDVNLERFRREPQESGSAK